MIALKQSKKSFAKKLACMLFAVMAIAMAGNVAASANDGTSKEPADLQQAGKTITGTVVDKNGEPLVGVSVSLQGTTVGTITDVDGKFSLKVSNDNQVLSFTYIGYKTVTVSAQKNVIALTMEEDALLMDEVVVTAMGIRKERKALGYAVQEINSGELLKNKTANPINSLAGKIAGVNVTQSSGSAGSGAQIILRGGTSLSRDNQPVFVVDGVIYDNTTSVNGDSAFDGLGGVATTNSNRIMDINPEDIESMSVLKGPAAAALYGSRAAAGVVIITTKRGQEGVVSVDVSSKFSSSWVNRLPEQQNKYKRGTYDGLGNLTDWTMTSWGEPFGAGEAVYDNIGSLFQNAGTWDNNISVSGGNKNGSFYVSASRFDQGGVIPSTGYEKTTFRFNGEQKYGRLTINANAAYSLANTDKTLTSAGLWGSSGTGAMESTYLWPRSDNMQHYLNEDGSKYRMFEGLQELVADVENPYWLINKNKMTDNTERFTGNLNLDFKIADWWSIAYRAGIDSYTTGNDNLVYPGGSVKLLWQNGMMSENDQRYKYISSNLMTNFSKTFGDFDLGLLLGTSTEDTNRETNRRMGYNFVSDDIFSYNTVVEADRTFSQSHSRKRMVSAYGEARVGYKSMAYLTLTERNDNTSTLPVKDRSYWYSSVGGSFIFSELLSEGGGELFSFGKIRASWARVGKDADPYVTNTRLTPYVEYLGDIVGVSNLSYPRGNPYLRPEMTEATELGFDLRFLKGRLGLEYTFYTNNSFDQIIEPRLSQTTGYIISSTNFGDLYNKGMELSITGQPVQTKDFVWDAMLNIAGNRGTVKNLPPGTNILYVTEVQVGNAKAASFEDGNFMAISGSEWTRAENGKVVLDAHGMPTSDGSTTIEIGNREPKFTGGFNNSLQYKDWNLSFLLDFRVGGHVYNGTDYYMTINGLSKISEDRETLVINGVENVGTSENPVYEDRSYTFNANGSYDMGGGTLTSGKNVIQEYYRTYYPKESANFMTETNWLRLRTLSLSYSLPANTLKQVGFIKGCMFTFSGNNLLLFTNYKGMDPETSAAGSGVTGSSSVGIDYCGVPATAGVSFGVNLKF
ncbi:MAG: SusC/RagA family TonB-linked outer membrane protein [Tannerella sp.]|jgi:TonB-linked SusC/RagA family outer membrane protein|nr:SusC/RagA family TonB-linked outer membrane protein [Tannerella sp.]